MEESTGLLFVGDTSITECKESEKIRSFYPRASSGRTTRERRDTHGTRLGRGGKEGKKKEERRKEEERSFKKNSSSRLRKTATQRSVGRSVAARPEIRVARAFYERKAGGEE